MKNNNLTYEKSGVNIKAADNFVKFISSISKKRVNSLIESMKKDIISIDENVQSLTKQIYHLTKDNKFKYSQSMGDIMETSLNYLLSNYENHSMLRTN